MQKEGIVPDRLGDALDNSEPMRHDLVCVKCGAEVKGSTAVGVRLAMQRHRNHCPGRKKKEEVVKDMSMNALEIGLRLQLMADEVNTSIINAKGQLAGVLADAIHMAMTCKNAGEFPITEVVDMLGENHTGTNAIVGNTVGVSEVAEAVAAMLQEVIAELERMSDASTNLSFVYTNVGADMLRAGGGSR
jgi:hypothetical protein